MLRLRTCQDHRARVMLLTNLSVEDGWANGTQARLLAANSWSGRCKKLSQIPEGTLFAQQMDLAASKGIVDFNVHVVRDAPQIFAKLLR